MKSYSCLSVLLVSLCLFCTGCGTFVARVACEGSSDKVYPAVAADKEIFFDTRKWGDWYNPEPHFCSFPYCTGCLLSDAVLLPAIGIVDLPISFLTDTLLLPFDRSRLRRDRLRKEQKAEEELQRQQELLRRDFEMRRMRDGRSPVALGRPKLPPNFREHLLLHLLFDDETPPLLDRSGRNNHGEIEGPSSVAVEEESGACLFDGEHRCVKLAVNIDETPPFSVTAWVLLMSYREAEAFKHYAGRTILTRGNLAHSGHWDYIFNVNANRKLGFVIHASGGADVVESKNLFPLGEWVFVAFTHDGPLARLYCDGQLAGENSNMPAGNRHNGFATFIGATYHSNLRPHMQNCWHGFIDNIAVYNTALTADEIGEIYQAQKTSSP